MAGAVMGYYSRRHYQAVSPARDTQAQIMERRIQRRASELGRADREQKYPELTAGNAQDAIDYQEQRMRFYAYALRAHEAEGR
jgi:hypothetical protein